MPTTSTGSLFYWCAVRTLPVHFYPMRNPMCSRLLFLFSLALLLSGCMTERIQPVADYAFVPEQTTFLIKNLDHDEHGRPVFPAPLRARPGKSGELFTLVHTVNKKPDRSYDIAIVEQEKGRPFAVIYEWTGRGFEGGMEISESIMPGGVISSGGEAAAYLAIKTAPMVLGGVTGFVVGILSSIPETAIELRRVIVSAREKVVAYTVYEYDEQGRIKFMKLYPPAEHAPELVRTEFFYEGSGKDPFRTEITSLIEKKVRILQ